MNDVVFQSMDFLEDDDFENAGEIKKIIDKSLAIFFMAATYLLRPQKNHCSFSLLIHCFKMLEKIEILPISLLAEIL